MQKRETLKKKVKNDQKMHWQFTNIVEEESESSVDEENEAQKAKRERKKKKKEKMR